MAATYGKGKIVFDRSTPGAIESIRQAGLKNLKEALELYLEDTDVEKPSKA